MLPLLWLTAIVDVLFALRTESRFRHCWLCLSPSPRTSPSSWTRWARLLRFVLRRRHPGPLPGTLELPTEAKDAHVARSSRAGVTTLHRALPLPLGAGKYGPMPPSLGAKRAKRPVPQSAQAKAFVVMAAAVAAAIPALGVARDPREALGGWREGAGGLVPRLQGLEVDRRGPRRPETACRRCRTPRDTPERLPREEKLASEPLLRMVVRGMKKRREHGT